MSRITAAKSAGHKPTKVYLQQVWYTAYEERKGNYTSRSNGGADSDTSSLDTDPSSSSESDSEEGE